MELSVIIINYNTFKLTCQCIESVLKHTRDVTYEIILVDNASTETTPEVFRNRFPTIILIESTENVGFSKGNNLGVSVASGEFILLLNSDAIIKNNTLKILYDFLVCSYDVAAVSARLEYPDGTLQHNCQRFPSVKFKLFELLRLQKLLPDKISGKILFGFFFDYKSIAYPDWIWGTCFMFRKNLLEYLPNKKLADDFFMYGEDIQWCFEFKKIGFKVAFSPNAHVVHYMGQSGGSKSQLIKENMQALMKQYYTPFHRRIIRILDYFLV